MAWLKSDQSLREHPKKDHLAELLFNGTTPNDVADYAAMGLLHALWYWGLSYSKDGDLNRFTDRQIAKGIGWQGDPVLLMQALTAAGFVDEDRRIHDWDEWAGALLEQRARNVARVQKARVTRNVGVTYAHVTGLEKKELKNKERSNSKRPVDNSTVRPFAVQEPVCWRCGKPISGDDVMDDKCVDSRKGLRHLECKP